MVGGGSDYSVSSLSEKESRERERELDNIVKRHFSNEQQITFILTVYKIFLFN